MYQTESENSSYDAATMRKLQEEVERAASNYESERQQYEDTYSTVEDRKSSSLDLGGDRPMPVSSSLDRLAKGIVDLYERLPVRLGLRVVLILLAFFITTFGISVEGDLDTGVGVMHLGFVNGDVEFVPIGAPGFSALQFMGVWTDLTVFVLLFPKIDLGKKLRMVMLAIAATFVYQITRGTLITAISRSLLTGIPSEKAYLLAEAMAQQLDVAKMAIVVIWVGIGVIAAIAGWYLRSKK